MKSIMNGAASAWPENEPLPSAFSAALASLQIEATSDLAFAPLRAWASKANSPALLIEPWIPAWDPQRFGGIAVNRGALLWALDEIAELDALDEAAILAAGLADEAASLHQVRVSRAPFGQGTALLIESASGCALVMSLAAVASGTDPRAVAWVAS